MKTIKNMLDEYSESHQNRTNQTIHKFAVPAIMFSIIGLFACIPTPSFLGDGNWSMVFAGLSLVYYALLSKKYFLVMLPTVIFMYIGNMFISQNLDLLTFSIIVFLVSWAFQFWGHKLEGKKPSFFKDVFFLLIGPLWVAKALFNIED